MDNIEELREDMSAKFREVFDANVKELMEPVREALLESSATCTTEEIIAQLLMNCLADKELGVMSRHGLLDIADHMGPDWAQALYRAAVFITKVA